ncbi:MAG: AAA family ATPase [Candidatus Cloacimonetes bacterium]|nr:AAA family ATPase [Candidatus Cloacimonadota bacterium]
MIESITMKNTASFCDVGIHINDMKKVNFIYGSNATGKTTISNYLMNPEYEKYVDTGCMIRWKNNSKLQTLVFNNDFRESNFQGKIAGIFTLGETTIDVINEIDIKNKELNRIKEDGVQKNKTIEKLKEDITHLEISFETDCWQNIYKKNENQLKEVFKGYMNNKKSFKEKVLLEFKESVEPILKLDDLIKKAIIIFGEQPCEKTIIKTISYEKILEIENNPIWEKIIVGKDDIEIAELIKKLNNSDWINQGRQFLQEGEICPFCQKATISDDFRKQLESFFDESYKNDLEMVSKLKSQYEILIQQTLDEINNIELIQKEDKNSKLDIVNFSLLGKAILSNFISNKEMLNGKIKEPSRIIELSSLQEQFEIINNLITDANEEIKKHNTVVKNLSKEKQDLIKSSWNYFIHENKDLIIKFLDKKSGLENGINNITSLITNLRDQYTKLNSETKNLNKQTTSIQPSIDEINTHLNSYGFLNIQIEPTKEAGYYQIKRNDGTVAEKTLSEGEITFITFLYYLQLIKGSQSTDDIQNDRILVIDDPISSLDSNVLFIVSSLIKEIIKKTLKNEGNIKQLILLTHNVFFHKEVSYIDKRNKDLNEVNYWMLRKNGKISSIQSYLTHNPISSSYELLWNELKNEGVTSFITIQNTMRRIIEYYFTFLGKFNNEDIINKFTNIQDKEICRSLFCWINSGSHDVNDDLFIEDQHDIVSKYKKVFRNIFCQTDNLGHFDMMMQEEDKSTI